MLTKSVSCGNINPDEYNKFHFRPQLFKLKYGTCMEKPRYNERYDINTLNSLRTLMKSDIISVSKNNRYNDDIKDNTNDKKKFIPLVKSQIISSLPQWRKFDKNVLNFKVYFNENITESNFENYRIRPCTLYYYLEDDTIQIIESKTENSGLV